MAAASTPRNWAPIRFHPRGRAEIPDAIRERCERVYALQADDTARFASVAADLRDRLDPTTRTVTAMTCDERFVILFENWAAGCDQAGIDCRTSTVVFPTDRATASRVEELGFVAHFDDESELLRGMTPSRQYGDRSWADYMYHQNWVIEQMLDLTPDIDLLFQDVDVVWRHDPRPALRATAEADADIQAMYDGPNPRFQPLYANSGFMYFRNNERVRSFWSEVIAKHELVGYYSSQQAPLNVMLAAHAQRGLGVRILDEDRFANGHLYCGGRTSPDDPWVVHHSWTRDLAQKLARYDQHGHWYLDHEALRAASEREPDPASHPPRPAPPTRPSPSTPASDDDATRALLELLGRVRRERDAHARSLEEMRNSRSWRMTAPLRRIKDAWLQRRRRPRRDRSADPVEA